MTKRISDCERIAISELPEVCTPEQIAAAIHVNPNVIRRKCVSGDIPAMKIGKLWRIGRDRFLHSIMPPKVRRIVVKHRSGE